MDEAHNPVHLTLLYHFCRLRLPAVVLSQSRFVEHLRRAFQLYQHKKDKETEGQQPVTWSQFLDSLHTLDLFLASACLDRCPQAWEALFSTRASRKDVLLVDALRSRAVRLFPRNQARQEEAVDEFWGYLLAGEKEGSVSILARYDGQRPLIPWLICVFQNKILSELRPEQARSLSLDPGAFELPLPPRANEHWHEEFCEAAREWFAELSDRDVLLLGLRLRYHLSQREVASYLGIHEGNVSKQTNKLSEHCRERIGQHLRQLGWTGDDLMEFILTELDSVLLAEPRMSVDRLAALLAARGKKLPAVS